jgi:hypothetical protein
MDHTQAVVNGLPTFPGGNYCFKEIRYVGALANQFDQRLLINHY